MAKMDKISKISQQLTPDEMEGISFIASVICNKRPDSLIGLYHCVRNKLHLPERFIATILKLAGHVKFTDDLCLEDVNEHFEGFRYINADQRKKMKMRALFVRIKQTSTFSSLEKMTEFGQTLLCESGVDTNYENCSRSYQLFQLLEEKGCVHVKDSSGLNLIKATLRVLQHTEVLELVDDFIKQDPPPYNPPVMPHMYQQQRSCPNPVGPPLPPSELERYNSLPAPYCELPSQHQNQPSHGLHVPLTLPFSSTHQAISEAQTRQHRDPIYINTQSSNPFFPAVPMSFQQQSSSSSPYYKPPAPTYNDRYHNVQDSRPSLHNTPHDQFFNRETSHFVNSNYVPPQPHQLTTTRPNAYPSHHQVYQSEASPLHFYQTQCGRQHSSPNNQHVVNSCVSSSLSPASNVLQCTSHSHIHHHESLVLAPQSNIGISPTQSRQYQQPPHYQQSSHSPGPSNVQCMPHWSTKQPTAQSPPPLRHYSNDFVPQSRRQCYSNAGHSNSFPPHSIRPQYSNNAQQSLSVHQYNHAIPCEVTEQLHQDNISMDLSNVSSPYHIDPVTEKSRDTK